MGGKRQKRLTVARTGLNMGSVPGNLLEKSRVRNTGSICVSESLKHGRLRLDTITTNGCLTREQRSTHL